MPSERTVLQFLLASKCSFSFRHDERRARHTFDAPSNHKFSVAAGDRAKLVGDRNLRVSLLLALGLSAAMTVTIDLDRPQQTLFGVNQEALMQLKEQMDNASSAAN